jgi:hypothetical protein
MLTWSAGGKSQKAKGNYLPKLINFLPHPPTPYTPLTPSFYFLREIMTISQPDLEPTWMTIIRLLRWDKPAGRLILMIPALWAVFLAADGVPPLPLIGVIILGTLATKSPAGVVNDLWDWIFIHKSIAPVTVL